MDGAPPGTARIYDQGYRPFTGKLGAPTARFWVIAVHELRQAWKEKWFKRLGFASLAGLPVFAILAIVQARFAGALGGVIELWLQFWMLQTFFAMVVVFFVGRRAVGEDLRTGALTVYFAHPVSFVQYLLGKWLAIAIGVAGVTLVPGLLLALIRFLAEPATSAGDLARWGGSLAILAAVQCLTFGWIMLAVSSLTRRGNAAGWLWVALYVLSAGLAEGLAHGTGVGALWGLGLQPANEKMAAYFFQGHGAGGDALAILGVQLAWAGIGFGVVLLRLRRWMKE